MFNFDSFANGGVGISPNGSFVKRNTSSLVGIMAGSKVATRAGWVAVEELVAGRHVLTYDDAYQLVRSVETFALCNPDEVIPHDKLPLLIPAGTIGNAADLTVLPDQPVMIESEIAETQFGQPFAVVPARALEQLPGVERQTVSQPLDFYTLTFDVEQVIFSSNGAMLYCPKSTVFAGKEPQDENNSYSVLPLEDSQEFLSSYQRLGRSLLPSDAA